MAANAVKRCRSSFRLSPLLRLRRPAQLGHRSPFDFRRSANPLSRGMGLGLTHSLPDGVLS